MYFIYTNKVFLTIIIYIIRAYYVGYLNTLRYITQPRSSSIGYILSLTETIYCL